MPTQDDVKQAAQQAIDAATPEDLAGAKELWDTHKRALGGVSSVTGAALPEWDECNIVAKAAHLAMFRRANRVTWDAFARRWVEKGASGAAVSWNRTTGT